MGERKPTLYCSVCKKLVLMDIRGNVDEHWADGEAKKFILCGGSGKAGTYHPSREVK